MPNFEIYLPTQFDINLEIAGNTVQQIRRPAFRGTLPMRGHRIGKQDCWIATRPDNSDVLIVTKPIPTGAFIGDILSIRASSLSPEVLSSNAYRKWISPQPPEMSIAALPRFASAARDSWVGKFTYRLEDPTTKTEGLRPPQLGALFATLAHWTVSINEPATIAMPTGTGKTETMLALMVEQRLPCVLVVVPTSSLREQIANKFLTLGILKRAQVLAQEAHYPVVGIIEHQLSDIDAAEAFLRGCNVVIATMQVINTCNEDIRRKLTDICSHLILDEAHHVRASTWDDFRDKFHAKPIVQFTATPFRNDGKHVGGRMIYSYPLRKAQQEGYFKSIRFRPIHTHIEADRKIAETAIDQLREDLQNGFDHLVMARVSSIAQAKVVHAIYESLAAEYAPLCIHSEMGLGKRRRAIEQLRARSSRIIVCVDMLGEGFDLPQLKIAALHDIHKSLAITLQFTGRFTRTIGEDEPAIGDATMIANRAKLDVQEQLSALYAEDADWDQIIRELGEGATEEEQQRSDFLRSFGMLPPEIPMQNIEPKMSTVVYRTDGLPWRPDALEHLFPAQMRYTKKIARSEQHRIAWFVTREISEVPWGELREMENVIFHLYLLHWDEQRHLLFINSSNNASLHEDIAKAVGGQNATLIRGEDVYKAMHNIHRMVATNLGLLDLVSRTRRFMMLMGADTIEGLDPTQSRNKAKTNVFGYGFENGERVSIGCSLKGRVWSHLVAPDLFHWMRWCHHVGAKMIDETIRTEEIFRNFVKPVYVQERPALVPLAIEWPLAFLAEQEDRISVTIRGDEVLFYDAGLEIIDFNKDQPIRFRVATEQHNAEYQLSFGADGIRYIAQGEEAQLRIGKRVKPLSEWFRQYAPKVHFEQDTFIEHDLLLAIDRNIPPFDPARIDVWNWTGTDIKKESQKSHRRSDSVQFVAIRSILASGYNWDVVFDDDDSGEVADIVALRMDNNRLIVHLYHCKYSSEPNPGSRVGDFYAVCGQAQKSVHWREKTGLSELIPHLIYREQQRIGAGEATRFERGDLQMLDDIDARREVLRPEFKIFVVQPGLSKAAVSEPILQLLASTALYLHETYNVDFGIIASA